MGSKILGHIQHNTVAYLAIVLVFILAPTSAYATHLVVRSSDIVDGQVKGHDLADDAVRSVKIVDGTVYGADVANDSITGTDVANDSIGGEDVLETSLGQVPSALQGGLGRYGSTGSCDPETTTFVPCSTVQVSLGKPARLLVIGTVRAASEFGSDEYEGECRIGTTSGAITASTDYVQSNDGGVGEGDYSENLTVMAVTSVFPAGSHTFGVDCNQGTEGAITYEQARVVAVALSAG